MSAEKIVGGIIGFAIGAISAGIGTYIFMNKRFEKKLEEEAAKIKETMEKLSSEPQEIKKSDDVKEDTEESEGSYPEDKTDIEEDEDEEEYEREEGEYTEYWSGMSNEERVKKLCDEYEEEYERMRIEEPDKLKYLEVIQTYSQDDPVQLITEELYNQNPWKYGKEHFTFYDDDCNVHLTNDDGEEVFNWMKMLGYSDGNFEDSMFRAYEDTIFIANHDNKFLYEITKSPSNWFDVQNGDVDW